MFGAVGPHAQLLGRGRTRSLLTRLLTSQGPIAEIPAADEVAAGLFVPVPGGYRLGPRILIAPALAAGSVAAAGATAAGLIRERLPAVRRRLRQPWDEVALLVVGGVLLDILVGERLRERALVGPATGSWRLWALEDPPAVTVGMRCDHDPDLRLGAGIMWVDRGEFAEPLPRPADLATLLDGESGPAQAVVALRLRRDGWLDGGRRRFLLLDRDELLDKLGSTAASLVDAAYRSPLTEAGGDVHARLMISRLIMERCLAELLRDGALPGLPPAIRRLAWRGPNWRLFEESATARATGKPEHVRS